MLKLNRTSHHLKHGISGFTIWRRPALPLSTTTTTELVWFDVHDDRLYHATVRQNKTAACGQPQMTLVPPISSIRFLENPFHVMLNDSNDDDDNVTSKVEANNNNNNNNSVPIVEKLVKVAIDNNKHMLFLSNWLKNRIDIYRLLVDTKGASNDSVLATWLASIDTEHPFDLTLDEDEHRLFWIANRHKVCSLFYGEQQQFTNSHCLSIDQPAAALTIDRDARQLYWIERGPDGHIRRVANFDRARQDGGGDAGERIYKLHDLPSISAMDFDPKTGRFYVGDQFEVVAIDPKASAVGEPELVQVELSTLFDLKLVAWKAFEETGSGGGDPTEVPMTTTTMITPTTSTTSPPPTTSKVVIMKRNLFVHFLIFVCTLVIFLAIFFGLRQLWRFYRRPDDEDEGDWRRLGGEEMESSGSRFARLWHCCLQRWWQQPEEDNYDQLSSAASVPSLVAAASSNVLAAGGEQANAAAVAADQQCQQLYRSNIRVAGQAPGLCDDIEDLLTSPSQISFVNPAAAANNRTRRGREGCLACREPDLCQEKGICMVTYRLQQRAC